MKQIKVLTTAKVNVPSSHSINLTEANQAVQEARRNVGKVIEGARTVESEMEDVISHYFMGQAHPRRQVFRSMILESDGCQFSTKRKLLIYIVNDLNLLEGNEKSKMEKLLRDVISFRNAFTHGRLLWDSGKVFLSFFEGVARKEELSDEYLTEVETCLISAFNSVFDLSAKIGAIQPAKRPRSEEGPRGDGK